MNDEDLNKKLISPERLNQIKNELTPDMINDDLKKVIKIS